MANPYHTRGPCGRIKPPFGTPLNRNHPLAPDLVWLFNEGGGVPYETARFLYGASGGQSITSPSGSSWVPSPYGMAFQFGSGTYLDVHSGVDSYDGIWCPPRLSIFAIVNPAGTNTRAIIGASNTFNELEFRLSATNTLDLVWPGTSDISQSVGTLTSGTWYTVGASYDSVAGSGQFYINGNLDTSFTGHTATLSQSQKPVPGSTNFFGFQDFWQGQMAFLMVKYRLLVPKDFRDLHVKPFDMWDLS